MKDTLASVGMIVALLSGIAFIFGLLRALFINDDKKFSIQIMVYSVIGFIIGFGTCYATFSLIL